MRWKKVRVQQLRIIDYGNQQQDQCRQQSQCPVRVEVLDADRSSGLVLVEQDRRNQEAAPTIGGLLGGLIPFPGGAILGQVAGKVLAEALGVPPTPEAVKNAIETGD